MSNSIQDTGTAAALINSLNAANSSVGKKTAASDPNSVSASQDKFLTLLVTQMKNQDPLNPMDNAQITSQMAQLSTVSGIDKLNSTLQALSNSMAVGQSVSSTSMIGHGVLVPGSSMNLANGQSIGGVELTQPADGLKVTIEDKAGNAIRTLQLGAQKAGVVPFAWDGQTDAGTTAANGSYKITAEATLIDVKTTPATLAYGMVNAVTPGAKGTTLDVGLLGGFALSDVKQVM